MSSSREKIEAIFLAASALETEAQRTAYLGRACPDPDLRREVETLLATQPIPGENFAKKTLLVVPIDDPGPATGAGALIGGYRIIRPLGRGGMGAVYEAEELESGRRIALKVLSKALDSPVARQRFSREGLLAASVNHPNTVYVYGTDECDGLPVIAMELIGGGTLQERVRPDRPMPVAEAVDAILQVIAGLEAAAELGVLHRDIKPSNCFVEIDGTVKVGDFGLSISSEGSAESKLTVTGAFLGTPAYCPPEQVRGDEFTIQGDLYAVGITLYYLLTGKTPFEGENMMRMLASVLERPAESPAELRADLPDGLCNAILRCLEKSPSDRFKNYAELRNALMPFSSVAPTPATLSLRFLAGGIDWVLCAGFPIALTLLSPGHWDALINAEAYPGTRFYVTACGFGFNLLYFTLPEGLWGASIGKWICGLRVTGPNRGMPGLGRAFLRALIIEGIPALPGFLIQSSAYFSKLPGGVLLPIFEGLSGVSGIIRPLMFITARRKNGFAAGHDLLTRTRVVRTAAHGARPALKKEKTRPAAPMPYSQLGAYQVLETLETDGSGEWLLGFDQQLRRKVWIRKVAPGTPPVAPGLRRLARVGRLRWLNGKRSADESWDVYESWPGKPLATLITRPQSWHRVRYWLLDLAEELSAAAKDQSLPAILNLDRVWITSEGRAKLLDFPTPGFAAAAIANVEITPQLFLNQVAVAALEGAPIAAVDARPDSVRIPLPPHARAILGELQNGLRPGALAERLKPLLHQLGFVSLGRRLAAVASCSLLPLALAAVITALVLAATSLAQSNSQTLALRQCLSHLSHLNANPKSTPEQVSERRDFERAVADHFRPVITNRATWTGLIGAIIPSADRSIAQQLVMSRPAPTEPELKHAEAVIETYLDKKTKELAWHKEARAFLVKPMNLVAASAGMLLACGAIPSLVAALLFQGGLVLRTLGLKVVKKDGSEASRHRIFLRAAIAWLPVLLLTKYAMTMMPLYEAMSAQRVQQLSLELLLGIGLVLAAALLPGRGLHDRLAGTCLVPRD